MLNATGAHNFGVNEPTCTVCGIANPNYQAPVATVTAEKKKNTLGVKAKTVTLKAKDVKKKNKTFAVKKVMTVSKAKGKVTYQLTNAKRGKKVAKKYFAVDKKTGKLTVNKGVKKGTYKVTVKVSAAGNKDYKAGTKSVTITVKVK